MSKAITLFVPNDLDFKSALAMLCSPLGFQEGVEESSIVWSSQAHFVNLREVSNSQAWVDDAKEWEWIQEDTREMLDGTKVWTFEYNHDEQVRSALWMLLSNNSQLANRCVLDNDLGVLLAGRDFWPYWKAHSNWIWRKETFPEFPGCPHSE